MLQRTMIVLGFAAALAVAGSSASHAQAYPTKPIFLVVPYPPGGPADAAARIIGERMQQSMGQPVIIENRPGASNIVANEYVARAPKDGHTLLFATNVLPIHPLTSKSPRYEIKDLAPISLTLTQPYALITSKSLPITDLKGFVEHAKKHPGALNHAVTGLGSVTHLIGKRFQQLTGTEMVAVSYKGASEAERDVMTGNIHFFPSSSLVTVALHRAGELRVLGMMTAERTPLAPDLPTLKEQGVDLVFESWFGICAPAGTPDSIIDRLNREIVAAVASKEYQDRIASSSGIAKSSTPAEFNAVIQRTAADLTEGIRSLGLQLQ